MDKPESLNSNLGKDTSFFLATPYIDYSRKIVKLLKVQARKSHKNDRSLKQKNGVISVLES